MEQGFYHPDRGYWQATTGPGEIPESTLAAYPAGTRQVPVCPGEHHEFHPETDTWVERPDKAEREMAAERAAMVVSPFQAEQALADAGLLPRVQSLINGKDARTQRAWARSTEIRRTSPLIAHLAAAISLSPEQVDALFRAAMQIKA